jgi:mxaD protein
MCILVFPELDLGLEIPFPVNEVWNLAGSFNDLPIISSATALSTLEDGGRIRVLTNNDGAKLWERLTFFDNEAKALSYEIVDTKGFIGRAYGLGYCGHIKVTPITATNTEFRYSAEFEPNESWSNEDAAKAVKEFARDCVAGICRRLELNNRKKR